MASHPPNDALADTETKTGAAVVLCDAFVGLLELAEDSRLCFRCDADAGVAHHEQHLVGQRARLDDDGDPTGLRELDGVSCEIKQHLAEAWSVANHIRGQSFIDIGRNLDIARLRSRRQ